MPVFTNELILNELLISALLSFSRQFRRLRHWAVTLIRYPCFIVMPEAGLILKGLRHGDLAKFWPKTILKISGSQLNPLRTFSLNI